MSSMEKRSYLGDEMEPFLRLVSQLFFDRVQFAVSFDELGFANVTSHPQPASLAPEVA